MPVYNHLHEANCFLRTSAGPQPIIVLNQAFCERHRRNCPPSEQLEVECSRVSANIAFLCHLLWQRLGSICMCRNMLSGPCC